ncbi:unnamed protein product, partial [Amoebophrya sp. A25]|eukprot:GSA25T00005452001.1
MTPHERFEAVVATNYFSRFSSGQSGAEKQNLGYNQDNGAASSTALALSWLGRKRKLLLV